MARSNRRRRMAQRRVALIGRLNRLNRPLGLRSAPTRQRPVAPACTATRP
ncbi:hypothetical protein N007_08820 [Alicyclobacillus acidoterrestris ATCC 49025]|nr:hypothetical protein N007_08820 [Alicyclobacillus acidoterrestris ATCC 49025]